MENPTKYYLQHFYDQEIMDHLKWVDPYQYLDVIRLHFIKQMTNHENINTCPECKGNIITDEWGEEYCEECGLVTRTHYPYIAGQKITLDYGIK